MCMTAQRKWGYGVDGERAKANECVLRWEVELYIQPGDYVPWVLALLIAAACILGIVVAVLYWMEKREDEMERRKALHIINFDAL